MKSLALVIVLLALVVAAGLIAQDADLLTKPHHRWAVVLTWEGDQWSALPTQIVPGSVQVFRNGLAIADQIDYWYEWTPRVFHLNVSKPDDIVLVTYDTL